MLTGGNIGNRLAYLEQARQLIAQHCGRIMKYSSVYETAAWGLMDQPAFYNQALALETQLTPDQLMRELLRIEEEMGRERTVRMGPRTIDLDILLIDQQIITDPLLTVPHPALPDRRFALLPLTEIAGELIHPVLHKTIRQLLEDCKDQLDVQKKSAGGN